MLAAVTIQFAFDIAVWLGVLFATIEGAYDCSSG